MDFFSELNHWHWLILALVLLGAEVMGAGGFLLGAVGAAAALTLVELFTDSLSWQVQISIFSVLTLMFSVIYRYKFNSFNNASDQPHLNDRAARMVGTHLVLNQDLLGGQGKQQIGDTLWQLQASCHLTAGTHVKVMSSEDRVLIIEAETAD